MYRNMDIFILQNSDGKDSINENRKSDKLKTKIINFIKKPTFQIALSFLIIAIAIRLLGMHHIRHTLGFPTEWVEIGTFESWGDYDAFYMSWVEVFWNEGWYMYSLGAPNPVHNIYLYTPVFFYIIAPFWFLPTNPIWIPILLGDAGTVIPVVLTAYKLKGKNAAIIAGLAYTFSPVNIFYEGGLWLNPGISNFFLFVGIYFWVAEKKYLTGNIFLIFAVMSKQLLLIFIFPLYFILFAVDPKEGVKQLVIAAVGCFVLACPYIILTPGSFIQHMVGFPMINDATVTDPGYNHPIRFTQTLAYWFENILNLDREVFAGFSYLYNTSLLMLLSFLGVIAWSVVVGLKEKSSEEIIHGMSIWLIVVNLIFSRGLYKYYFTAIFPILAIIFPIMILNTYKNRREIFAFGSVFISVYIASGLLMIILHRQIYEWIAIYYMIFLFCSYIGILLIKWRRKKKII
ncbi:MAG: hypothetical protein ACTSUV_03855 [Candidatus Ranarchaeia archaeon]